MMNTQKVYFSFFIFLFLGEYHGLQTQSFISQGYARSFRINRLPNFSNYGCSGCHRNGEVPPRGSNPFGGDVWDSLDGIMDGVKRRLGADPNWDILFFIDSDGDGYSNGQELGDPHGRWTQNTPNVQWTSTTNPNDPKDYPGSVLVQIFPDGSFNSSFDPNTDEPIHVDVCGDGAIGLTEECDGLNLNGES